MSDGYCSLNNGGAMFWSILIVLVGRGLVLAGKQKHCDANTLRVCDRVQVDTHHFKRHSQA